MLQLYLTIKLLVMVQASAAGPFDACFCVGPAFSNSPDDSENSMPEFPLPVYCIGDYGHAVPVAPVGVVDV